MRIRETAFVLAIVAGVAFATQEGSQTAPPPPDGHFLHNFIINPQHPSACPSGCKGFEGDYGAPGHRGPRGMSGPDGQPGIPGYYVTYAHGHLPGMPPEGSVLNEQILYNPSVKGPQGDLGDVGAAGDNGPDGLPGAPGRSGRLGRIGRIGEFGEPGFPGEPGDIGVPGPSGVKGTKGPLGYRGTAGGKGFMGSTGTRGLAGDLGAAGDTGSHGVPGDAGSPGFKGVSGADGITGPFGPKGMRGGDGSRGQKGFTGIPGNDGAPGLVGIQGDMGQAGIPGSVGRPGEKGFKGRTGPYIEKVGVNETVACEASGRSKVKYDPFVKKLYYCNGNKYQCVESDPCSRDCQVSEWEPWRACSSTCGEGTQVRERRVLQAPGGSGSSCPFLADIRVCSTGACSCDVPSLQNGGTVGGVGATVARDSLVTWQCNAGYRLIGASVSRCLRTGSLDSLPECSPIQCSDPGVPSNGVRTATANPISVGDSLTHQCNAGFNIDGMATMMCLADGTWSQMLPFCQPMDCSNPGTPANGGTTATSGVTGTVATYSCNFGYNLAGSTSRTCQANGQWTNSLPTCNLVSCGDPGTPQFGSRRGDSFTFGSDVSFSCNSGYLLSGSRSRHCQADGTWSGQLASCELRVCPPVSDPVNGAAVLSNRDRVVGTTATFSCRQDGHELTGASRIECQASGVWSQPGPECQVIECCAPSAPANGEIVGLRPRYEAMKDSAQYSCDDGYRLQGVAERRCLTTGWSDAAPTCEPITCSDPGVPVNGRRLPLYGVFLPANRASFSCDNGYRMQGEPSLTCRASGQWDDVPPTCEVITCTPPVRPTNGQRIGTDFTYSTSLQFVCDADFTLRGSMERTCQLNGQYDGEEAFCDPDCTVGEFAEFSQCSTTCGPGTRTRDRNMLQEPSGMGQACPELQEAEVCNLGYCIQCENGAYSLGETAYVTPTDASKGYAADIVVVVERAERLADTFVQLRKFLAAIELDLTGELGIGSNPMLPNMYTLVGFGGATGSATECGHQILTDPARPGVTAFPFSKLSDGLDGLELSRQGGTKDGYQAILYALQSEGIRHSSNIAHNLIFLSNSSRGDTCGVEGNAKNMVRAEVLRNGFTANFIVDHQIRIVRDKSQEVLGVRSFLVNQTRLAYIEPESSDRGYTTIDPAVANLLVDYESSAYGTINEDYTQLALDLGGVLWNMNNFNNRHPASSAYTSFNAAFRATKTQEITSAARSCKLCTCMDGGNGNGDFRCRMQPNDTYCKCRESGGTDASCS